MFQLYAVASRIRAALRAEKGQTMAEYAVVLAVIVLGVVVAIIALSGGIGNAINGVRARLP
jgi:Flp pilus assembly pilin Flp